MGLRPAPDDGARSILTDAANGSLDLLVLLGADPISDHPDADLARRAMAGARRVLSIDTLMSPSSQQADLVMPAAAYGEQHGTTTNLEGRVTSLVAKVTVAGTARPDWMIAADLAAELGHDLGIGSVQELTDAIAGRVPGFSAVTASAMAAERDGILTEVPAPTSAVLPVAPTVPARNSYDFRLVVSRKLYDAAVQTAASPSLAPLAAGARIVVNPVDLDRIGVPEGAEAKVIGSRGAVMLPVHTDAGVPRGIAWSPFNQPGVSIGEVIDHAASVTDVRIERP
jgi:NADH-quinone oxidoreductase subunit G